MIHLFEKAVILFEEDAESNGHDGDWDTADACFEKATELKVLIRHIRETYDLQADCTSAFKYRWHEINGFWADNKDLIITALNQIKGYDMCKIDEYNKEIEDCNFWCKE